MRKNTALLEFDQISSFDIPFDDGFGSVSPLDPFRNSTPYAIDISALDDPQKVIATLSGHIKQPSLTQIYQSRAKKIQAAIHSYYHNSPWGKPCRNMFEHLATSNPEMLINIIRHGELDRVLQTFAVEALGDVPDAGIVMSILNPLLASPDSLIREGAVYGLGRHMHKTYVREALTNRLQEETSRGVRIAIMEALEIDEE